MIDYRDIEITGSTIRNGRIYFNASDASFFHLTVLVIVKVMEKRSGS